jgi:hypothetical protein
VVVLAVIFIPLGQALGMIFEASANRLRDYGLNLLGSLLGVGTYTVMCYFHTPPWAWFLLSGAGLALFLPRRPFPAAAGAILLPLIVILSVNWDRHCQTLWSPYQRIDLQAVTVRDGRDRIDYWQLKINAVFYMTILDLSSTQVLMHPNVYALEGEPFYPYNLPFRFQERPRRVLVVGAGAGNDVAAAVRNGAGAVDAVEIDPVIAALGQRLHPERPYQDPRVNLVIADARSFFNRRRERYDLILFALLDSHTLTSNFSNISLDSYVYTRESLAAAKSLLAEGGLLALKFQVGRPWLGAKLYALLAEVFGEPPLVVIAESRNLLFGSPGIMFLAGDLAGARARLAADTALPRGVSKRRPPLDYSTFRRGEDFEVPSDDWPYLYLQKRQMPVLYLVMLPLLLFLMIAGIGWLFPGRRIGSWHFLFLGAGFLLVEVHSITKAALLFGSTWMVNTVMISAVLVMGLLANLVVMKRPRRRLLLCASWISISRATSPTPESWQARACARRWRRASWMSTRPRLRRPWILWRSSRPSAISRAAPKCGWGGLPWRCATSSNRSTLRFSS